jgi:hypothetical protein
MRSKILLLKTQTRTLSVHISRSPTSHWVILRNLLNRSSILLRQFLCLDLDTFVGRGSYMTRFLEQRSITLSDADLRGHSCESFTEGLRQKPRRTRNDNYMPKRHQWSPTVSLHTSDMTYETLLTSQVWQQSCGWAYPPWSVKHCRVKPRWRTFLLSRCSRSRRGEQEEKKKRVSWWGKRRGR